jgi:hypothetical protein
VNALIERVEGIEKALDIQLQRIAELQVSMDRMARVMSSRKGS